MTDDKLREAVLEALAEWDILPTERKYTLEDVTDWMQRFMAPAMDKLREAVTPKPTRYDWPAIVAKYPEARWAVTNEDGAKCATDGKRPNVHNQNAPGEGCWTYNDAYHGWMTVAEAGAPCPDWRDSLEERPEGV